MFRRTTRTMNSKERTRDIEPRIPLRYPCGPLTSGLCAHPTINIEGHASDIACGRAGQEGHDCGNLLGFAKTAKRNQRTFHIGEIAAVWIHFGRDWTSLYYIDGDRARRQVTRPRAAVHIDCGFRGGVIAGACPGGAFAEARSHVNDATTIVHQRNRCPNCGSYAVDIDRKGALDGSQVDGWGAHRTGKQYTSIVHQDIEFAKLLHGLLYQRDNLGGIGLVGLDRGGTNPERLHFFYDGFGAVGGSRITDDHISTVAGQFQGDGGTHAAGATGDKGDFFCEWLVNDIPV